MATSSYRTPGVGRGVLLAAFAAALAIFLIVVITSIAQADTSQGRGGTPTWFLLAWLAIYLFLAWVYLVRTAYRLDMTQEELVWRSPLREGRIQLADLRSIAPLDPNGVMPLIRSCSSPALPVLATKGFTTFCDTLAQRAPQIRMEHGWYARLAARLPGKGGHQG